MSILNRFMARAQTAKSGAMRMMLTATASMLKEEIATWLPCVATLWKSARRTVLALYLSLVPGSPSWSLHELLERTEYSNTESISHGWCVALYMLHYCTATHGKRPDLAYAFAH